jgi:hypothetical protein
MTPFARAIGDALLKRHKELCSTIDAPLSKITDAMIRECTIAYLPLCEKVGAADLARSVGKPLTELAAWCEAHGFPPVYALAVDGQTRVPSPNYYEAPSCRDWPSDVRKCIVYKNYPATTAAVTKGVAASSGQSGDEVERHGFDEDFQNLCVALQAEYPTLGKKLVGITRTKDGLTATRQILNAPRPTTGFRKLINDGRKDLTVEALTLRHPTLYTSRQVSVAKSRLANARPV